jgi:imidazoleglycerol-phosphate dehydratase
MRNRKVSLERKTRETKVTVDINLDGKGNFKIDTGIPFMDHVLSAFAKHGKFDLKLKARGDIHVDLHHTTEDTGIALGGAFLKALSKKKGIRRFGYAYVPMDEVLVLVVVDISGRPYLEFNVKFPQKKREEFNPELIEEFMRGFVNESRVTVHVNLLYGKNNHHIIEAIFKALGLAFEQATRIDPRLGTVPSTKGKL